VYSHLLLRLESYKVGSGMDKKNQILLIMACESQVV